MTQRIKLVRNAEEHSLTVNAVDADWQQLTNELHGVRFPASANRLVVEVIWGRISSLNEHIFLLKLASRVSGRYSMIGWNVRRGSDQRSERIPTRT